jgi:predicted acylesterase/phospholipase RssA
VSLTGLHFTRTAELAACELRMVRALCEGTLELSKTQETLLRYAMALARIWRLQVRPGREVELADELAPFRAWVRDSICSTLSPERPIDAEALRARLPALAVRLHAIRDAILLRHSNELDEGRIESELSTRRLTLALGGGGGGGYAHLALFELLEEMGAIPEYIAGTSIGSLMGFFRAVRRHYDPVTTTLLLPRKVDLPELIRPFTGWNRFGLPGAFDLEIHKLAGTFCKSMLGSDMPRLSELPIPLACMCTGLQTGFEFDAPQIETGLRRLWSRFTPFLGRSLVGNAIRVFRRLVENERLIQPVLFSAEQGLGAARIFDAIAFSSSVPGVLHADIFDRDPEQSALLERLFEDRGLFRLSDGGPVSNVPVQAVWEAVARGVLGSRNALIYAIDVFAPSANRYAMFFPLQQLARPNVLRDRRYADFFHTVRNLPNPIDIAPSYRQIQSIVRKAREELQPDMPVLRRMLKPLPRYASWFDAI